MLKELGSFIKEVRTEHELTVTDMSYELGITKTQYYRKEKWIYPFTLKEIKTLSNMFGKEFALSLFNKFIYNDWEENKERSSD